MDENYETTSETTLESLSDEEGLFDDWTSDTPEATEEEELVEETAQETEEEYAENAPVEEENVQNDFLRVKFNGEERALTEDEARTLAQKGLNYDRFYEPLERLARLNNMSVGDYVNQLNETQTQYEVEKEMDSLREDPKYADVSDEVLEEIAQSRVKDFIGQRDQYFADQAKEQADAQQAQIQSQIDKFMDEYPEFKNKGPDSLDPKVYEYVGKGYTLLEAYNKFQREQVNQNQMDLKAKASQKNMENKKKALGNTTNAGTAETDAFLDGLFNS